MPDHTTIRLTIGDYDRITVAVDDYAARSAGVIASERLATAERIAHHAIGCTAADLREGELAYITAVVHRVLAGGPTPDVISADTAVSVETTIHGFNVALRRSDNRVTRVARYLQRPQANRHAERLLDVVSAGLPIEALDWLTD